MNVTAAYIRRVLKGMPRRNKSSPKSTMASARASVISMFVVNCLGGCKGERLVKERQIQRSNITSFANLIFWRPPTPCLVPRHPPFPLRGEGEGGKRTLLSTRFTVNFSSCSPFLRHSDGFPPGGGKGTRRSRGARWAEIKLAKLV
jgi:hypothetical protein